MPVVPELSQLGVAAVITVKPILLDIAASNRV